MMDLIDVEPVVALLAATVAVLLLLNLLLLLQTRSRRRRLDIDRVVSARMEEISRTVNQRVADSVGARLLVALAQRDLRDQEVRLALVDVLKDIHRVISQLQAADESNRAAILTVMNDVHSHLVRLSGANQDVSRQIMAMLQEHGQQADLVLDKWQRDMQVMQEQTLQASHDTATVIHQVQDDLYKHMDALRGGDEVTRHCPHVPGMDLSVHVDPRPAEVRSVSFDSETDGGLMSAYATR